MAQNGGGLPPDVRHSNRLAERPGQGGRGSAAQHLGAARSAHGTLSRAHAAAIHLIQPQSGSVAHVPEAVNINATAVLTRSGVATPPILDRGFI